MYGLAHFYPLHDEFDMTGMLVRENARLWAPAFASITLLVGVVCGLIVEARR
ncbi:MAG: hypothetical protein PSX37_05745 [bacterium]|nr:hypothetical protein [bacterium]